MRRDSSITWIPNAARAAAAEIAATLTVGNVFDKDPSFYRATIPYNTAYDSPLGRTFKFGVTKRF